MRVASDLDPAQDLPGGQIDHHNRVAGCVSDEGQAATTVGHHMGRVAADFDDLCRPWRIAGVEQQQAPALLGMAVVAALGVSAGHAGNQQGFAVGGQIHVVR
ncbi:hypothetical protein D3C78_1390610 [compost metagenome]